jgi:hypothetical protein
MFGSIFYEGEGRGGEGILSNFCGFGGEGRRIKR